MNVLIVNILLASSDFPFPRLIAITVDAPVENRSERAKMRFIVGIAIFTAASASCPT